MKRFLMFCICCIFAIVANAQYYHRHHYVPRASCGGGYVVTRTIVHRPIERVVVREEPRYTARTTTNITNNYYYATEKPKQTVEVRKPSNTCRKPYAEYDFDDDCSTEISKVATTSIIDGINPHDVKYTIWFKLNSHKLKQKSDVINCQNAAEILERYPNLKLVVYGYASQRSGTTSYNDVLAQRRIDEVTNYLINGCHVDWSRIKFVNKGSREAAYSNDEWNQNVILKFE